jgi:hypothetical protein
LYLAKRRVPELRASHSIAAEMGGKSKAQYRNSLIDVKFQNVRRKR